MEKFVLTLLAFEMQSSLDKISFQFETIATFIPSRKLQKMANRHTKKTSLVKIKG